MHCTSKIVHAALHYCCLHCVRLVVTLDYAFYFVWVSLCTCFLTVSLFTMAAMIKNRDPDLDAFDRLLAIKKSGSGKNKKLRDHYVGLLNERNKLKEQVALVMVSPHIS